MFSSVSSVLNVLPPKRSTLHHSHVSVVTRVVRAARATCAHCDHVCIQALRDITQLPPGFENRKVRLQSGFDGSGEERCCRVSKVASGKRVNISHNEAHNCCAFCGLKQSEINSNGGVDWFYQVFVVNLRVVDVAADFMTNHFGRGVWHENVA